MKRKIKRIASLVLAAVMVFAMAMPAMATITDPTRTYSIQIKGEQKDKGHNHKYVAYQIFKGDYYSNEETGGPDTLSTVSWNDAVVKNEGQKAVYGAFNTAKGLPKSPEEPAITDIKGLLKYLENETDAQLVAQTLMGNTRDYLNGAGVELKWNDAADDGAGAYVADSQPGGYYLIVDQMPSGEGDNKLNAGDAYSSYMVQVVKNLTIAPKTSVPSVDKQVADNDDKDTADTPAGDGNYWGDTADHEINEQFQFKLTATIPADEHRQYYEDYVLVFNDTMSEGLTYDSGTTVAPLADQGKKVVVTVKIGETTYTLAEGADKDFTVTTSKGDENATLLTVKIADLLKAPVGNPEAIEAIQNAFKGSTADIVVEVLYWAHLNENAKIAQPGVGTDANINKVNLDYSRNPNSTGDGDLGKTPEETVYVFTYDIPNKKVEAGEDGEEGTFTDAVKGAKFKLYKSDEGKSKSGDPLKLVHKKDSVDGIYYLAGSKAAEELGSDYEFVTEMSINQTDGTFNIKGLDDGYYLLEESVVPAGFNKCDDILIEIIVEKHEAVSGSAETTFERKAGGLSIGVEGTNTIINDEGATLPETGGIGTTIFYVVGSVLVLGAVILLVTKRRMKSE